MPNPLCCCDFAVTKCYLTKVMCYEGKFIFSAVHINVYWKSEDLLTIFMRLLTADISLTL